MPKVKRRLRIASYNINGVTSHLEVLLRWLRIQPDIACLQELKTTDDTFPSEALEHAGYAGIWHGQKSWNGVAISAASVSRLKPGAGSRRSR